MRSSWWMMVRRMGPAILLKELDGREKVRVILHEKNQGKGAAVRTGMDAAQGEILLIQDADLEYDPRDYPTLLQPLEEGIADVVYGSRFLGGPRRVTMYWHMVANKLLTFMTNILYNTILSDMETGYKVFRRKVVDGDETPLQTLRFRARVHCQGVETALPHLRGSHFIQSPRLFTGQEDQIKGRLRGGLDFDQIQICGLVKLD